MIAFGVRPVFAMRSLIASSSRSRSIFHESFFGIDEHRRSSQIGDGVARSAEGERLYQYFVAGADSAGYQCQMHGGGARYERGNFFIPADKGFELMLEGVAVGAEGNCPVFG